MSILFFFRQKDWDQLRKIDSGNVGHLGPIVLRPLGMPYGFWQRNVLGWGADKKADNLNGEDFERKVDNFGNRYLEFQKTTKTRQASLFVCGICLTSGQLVSKLFPDCTRSCFLQVVLCRRGGDRIYEMRCLFVAVGLNARFIVLPHWDNMSQAHRLTHPVTLYWHRADQLCFVVPPLLWVPCKKRPLPFLNVFGMTGPGSNRESNLQILLVSAGSPLASPFTISRGYWGPIRYKGAPSGDPTPDPHGARRAGRRAIVAPVKRMLSDDHDPEWVDKRSKCVACIECKRHGSLQNARSTQIVCAACKVPLCIGATGSSCWAKWHHTKEFWNWIWITESYGKSVSEWVLGVLSRPES